MDMGREAVAGSRTVRSGLHSRSARRRVGILDLLTTPARSVAEIAYNLVMTKQYASVTPQAIAVWCRELGHQTFYATYFGSGDPRDRLPDDLDVIFIASYTQASALAYALAKLYRRRRTMTVIGGPHAKAFPRDCLRFFDLVVGDCDKALVADILWERFDPGSIIASAQPFTDLPTVEERMPEIRASAFALQRPVTATTFPLLASVGCPYACDFCIDWDSRYRTLPLERLAADLRYLARHFPGAMVGFHDPNFPVNFDQVLDVMESIPPVSRNPYVMETSLSVLRGKRIQRLRETNCVYVAPGIESWSAYASKAGVGRAAGVEKVRRVVEHLTQLHEHVPYIQANFLFGLDGDRGDEPVLLTKEFMTRTPFVWPVINIPHPFGKTPFFRRYLTEKRILTTMPFSFYYSPYVVTTLANYTPLEFYEKLIELFSHFTSTKMLLRRLATTSSPFAWLMHVVRTQVKRRRLGDFRRLHSMLRTDPQFRAFHEGRSTVLPEFYQATYERMLGPFAGLMSRRDRIPELGQ